MWRMRPGANVFLPVFCFFAFHVYIAKLQNTVFKIFVILLISDIINKDKNYLTYTMDCMDIGTNT